jgi:hypothetical protein
MRTKPVELPSPEFFCALFLVFGSGIDGISTDLLLHLLDLLQHSPDGRCNPVEHSICIIHELACVVG